MAHTVDKIIKNTDGSLGGIKRKKKKESKKTEQYENPYFGKKKPTSPDLMTWDVTKNYTGKEKKAKGGRIGLKHGSTQQEIPTRLSKNDEDNKKVKTLKYKPSKRTLPPGKSILMKAKGGRIGYKHGGAAKRGHGCEIK